MAWVPQFNDDQLREVVRELEERYAPLHEKEFRTYWWAERREMQAGSSRPTATRTPAAHHADALDALRYAVLGVIKGLLRSAHAGVVEQAWDRAERGTGARETLHERVERLRKARQPGVI